MRIANVTLSRRRNRARRDEATTPAPTGCWAPDSTLYFGPDGSVRACCVNTQYPLGHVGESSIREIWEGARTKALRQALAADDYSLGCQECGAYIEAGNRAWSNAPQFDEYAGIEVPEYPTRMDFILSNTCNLMCEMCHGGLSSAIRAKREKLPPLPKHYGDDFFEELREFLPHLQKAVFLGGEPFLARESRRVWDLMIEMGLQIPTTVVTNGTQWNDKVERYVREIPMDVTVSIDGSTAQTVESLRVGTDFDELMANVDRFQEIVEPRGGAVSLHYCLMAQNWWELGDYLLEADRKGRRALIMTVTDPQRFSFYHMETAALRGALADLEAEDERIRDRLELNRDVWTNELDRLRRHLAALEDGEDTSWIVAMSAAPERDPVRQQRFDDESERLERWAGRPPIEVTAVGDVVRSVALPDWAAELDTDGWIGVQPIDLIPAMAVHLGPVQEQEALFQHDGVDEFKVTFGEGERPTEVHSLILEARGSDDEMRLRMFLADPELATPRP